VAPKKYYNFTLGKFVETSKDHYILKGRDMSDSFSTPYSPSRGSLQNKDSMPRIHKTDPHITSSTSGGRIYIGRTKCPNWIIEVTSKMSEAICTKPTNTES
jgi:hypothetical protein